MRASYPALMHPRIRLALVVAGACLVAVLAGAAVFGGGRSKNTSSDVSPTGFAGALKPPGARAPDFRLHDDETDATVTMRQFRGRTVIVTFMYSTCQDTCPLTAQQIRGALDELGHDVPVLIVSVDPKGDTPFHVKRFLVKEQLAGRATYLTGTRTQLAPVWKGYGIQPQGKGFEHTAASVIVDGSGLQRIGFLSSGLVPEDLAHDLRKLGS
jgi:protein SCO1/2